LVIYVHVPVKTNKGNCTAGFGKYTANWAFSVVTLAISKLKVKNTSIGVVSDKSACGQWHNTNVCGFNDEDWSILRVTRGGSHTTLNALCNHAHERVCILEVVVCLFH